MKRLLLLPLLLFLFSCGNDISQDAASYNDRVVGMIDSSLMRYEFFAGKLNAADSAGSLEALKKLDEHAARALDTLQQLSPPGETNEDAAFKAAAIGVIQNTKEMCGKEYVLYHKILFSRDTTLQTDLDSLLNVMNEKDAAADAKLTDAQARFARRYKVQLE